MIKKDITEKRFSETGTILPFNKNMESFTELNLNPFLMQSIKRMQFKIPTPIQAQAIPPALLGKDVLGTAQTGTGKSRGKIQFI